MLEFIETVFNNLINSTFVSSITDFFDSIADVVESIGSYANPVRSMWDLLPEEVQTLIFGIIVVSFACTIVHALLRKV